MVEEQSFLTEQQVEVLRLREQGLKQREIAERIGTTRANVSIIEKRARQNIDRAYETIRLWNKLRAPIRITVPPETDVFDIPKIVYDGVEGERIKIVEDSVQLVARVQEEAGDKIRRRRLIEELEVYVGEDGRLTVE